MNKGEMLITEGQVDTHLYQVSSVALRIFLLTEYEEQTIRFGYSGPVINSLGSFLTGRPSEFYL